MNPKILDRWFPPLEVELEEATKEAQENAYFKETAKEWLNCTYMTEFKNWLTTMRRESDPRPGDHANMLYQTGLRDGIQKIRDYMDDLEARIGRQD